MTDSAKNMSETRFVRAYAWSVLLWEKLWPLLTPLFMVLCAFLVFSWAGGWRLLQQTQIPVLIWGMRLGVISAFIVSLLPLRAFALPSKTEINRRIEEKSNLEHRPITAQDDPMAMGDGDGFSAALWREHQSRMSAKLENMTAGAPKPDANRLDPFAVRAMLPIAAFAAFFFSFSPLGGSITDISGSGNLSDAVNTRMDAWLNPPAYTKKPPVYLSLSDGSEPVKSVNVPNGSQFVLRFVGDTNVEVLKSSLSGEAKAEPEKVDAVLSEVEYSFEVEENTTIRLISKGRELANWNINLTEDSAPEIEFVEEPRSALSGSLELAYSVKDDYGVVSAEAKFTSLEDVDSNAVPLVEAPSLKLALPRQRATSGTSKLNRDLTEHPWAGSRVTITLEAVDDLGQIGRSKIKEMVLPGRRFTKPLALALIEQRRVLALDARKQHYVANLLDAVSSGPAEYIDNINALLGMKVAYRRIVSARDHDALRSSLDLLWDIALAVEFGDLSEAERKLREAQERLSEALENGASDEEISRLMQEMRQAMNEMLQALAEQARNNPQQQNPFEQSDAQRLTQNDLDKMMQRIEELAKSGAKDAARQLLSEMQRMMDNLRSGQQQQQQAGSNEMNKALDKMSELMQRQQQLLNETHQLQRQQQEQMRQQQGQQDGQQQQGQEGQMSEQELADALEQLRKQQEALKEQLGQLADDLEGMGLGKSEQLGQAQSSMDSAGKNLSQGETGEATTNQADALDKLRQGAQQMMQQMAGNQQGQGEPGQQNGEGLQDAQRGNDPLGRRSGANQQGQERFGETEIPTEADVQRTRRILEAIRKRLSIPENPLVEKDYLERLLKSE
jgi:uncharacterized protein (TIGR02302 family)